jgi:hypothetical protein
MADWKKFFNISLNKARVAAPRAAGAVPKKKRGARRVLPKGVVDPRTHISRRPFDESKHNRNPFTGQFGFTHSQRGSGGSHRLHRDLQSELLRVVHPRTGKYIDRPRSAVSAASKARAAAYDKQQEDASLAIMSSMTGHGLKRSVVNPRTGIAKDRPLHIDPERFVLLRSEHGGKMDLTEGNLQKIMEAPKRLVEKGYLKVEKLEFRDTAQKGDFVYIEKNVYVLTPKGEQYIKDNKLDFVKQTHTLKAERPYGFDALPNSEAARAQAGRDALFGQSRFQPSGRHDAQSTSGFETPLERMTSKQLEAYAKNNGIEFRDARSSGRGEISILTGYEQGMLSSHIIGTKAEWTTLASGQGAKKINGSFPDMDKTIYMNKAGFVVKDLKSFTVVVRGKPATVVDISGLSPSQLKDTYGIESLNAGDVFIKATKDVTNAGIYGGDGSLNAQRKLMAVGYPKAQAQNIAKSMKSTFQKSEFNDYLKLLGGSGRIPFNNTKDLSSMGFGNVMPPDFTFTNEVSGFTVPFQKYTTTKIDTRLAAAGTSAVPPRAEIHLPRAYDMTGSVKGFGATTVHSIDASKISMMANSMNEYRTLHDNFGVPLKKYGDKVAVDFAINAAYADASNRMANYDVHFNMSKQMKEQWDGWAGKTLQVNEKIPKQEWNQSTLDRFKAQEEYNLEVAKRRAEGLKGKDVYSGLKDPQFKPPTKDVTYTIVKTDAEAKDNPFAVSVETKKRQIDSLMRRLNNYRRRKYYKINENIDSPNYGQATPINPIVPIDGGHYEE